MVVFPIRKTNRKPKDNQEKRFNEPKPLGPISLATKIVESKDWTYGIKFNTSTSVVK